MEGKLAVNEDKCIECGKCVSTCPVSALIVSNNRKPVQDVIKKENEDPLKKSLEIAKDELHNGGVWVFAEQLEGKLASVTLELIGAAKRLASKLNVQVSAVLLGERVESIAPILFEYGANTVYFLDDPVFHFYRTETYM